MSGARIKKARSAAKLERELYERMMRWLADALRTQRAIHERHPHVLIHRPGYFVERERMVRS